MVGEQPIQNDKNEENLPVGEQVASTPVKDIEQPPSIENMEVHHHPHVPHGKKKFGEYFLEFLMIFLAVALGFFAENFREYIADNEKEKYYIESLVKDLKTDTAALNIITTTILKQELGFDSVRAVTKDKLSEVRVQDSLFRYTITYLFYSAEFKNSDVALTQLRNSGGYSLIKDTKVLDSIAVYESNLNTIKEQYRFVENSFIKTRDIAMQIFDVNNARKFLRSGSEMVMLTTGDKEKVALYYNNCWFTEVALKGYNQMLKAHLQYITGLISFLQKEYE